VVPGFALRKEGKQVGTASIFLRLHFTLFLKLARPMHRSKVAAIRTKNGGSDFEKFEFLDNNGRDN
jgi:hypothetical protein